jgi:hypothetical protein
MTSPTPLEPAPGAPGPPLAPPPGRYGPAPVRSRRLVVAALVLLGVAAVALAAWLGLRVGVVPVDWHDVGFSVEGDDLLEVTFDVTRPDPSRPASCVVEALNESHAQVGVVTVEVPASADGRVRLTTTVRTSERAVSGTVVSCRLTD